MKNSDNHNQKVTNGIGKIKKRKVREIPPNKKILISCEGIKTEVNYFKGFADKINRKYYEYSRKPVVSILGTGRNCKSLLEYTRRIIEKQMNYINEVWLVYDRDNFPPDDFDNTEYSIEHRKDKKDFHAAWSNECFELWLILHFQNYNINQGRESYLRILRKYCSYEKNDENLFEIFYPMTDIAIKRARKQYDSFPDGVSPSKKCPATKVYELVEELQKLIKNF